MYRDAIKRFNKILNQVPNYLPALYGKGNSLYGLKNYEAAIELFIVVVESDSTYVDAWFNMGNALRQIANHHEAISAYEILQLILFLKELGVIGVLV